MMEGRKYVLGLNSGLIFGTDVFPPEATYLGDVEPNGVAMLVHMEDVDIDPVIVMDETQAKELIKAIKRSMKEARKKNGNKKASQS